MRQRNVYVRSQRNVGLVCQRQRRPACSTKWQEQGYDHRMVWTPVKYKTLFDLSNSIVDKWLNSDDELTPETKMGYLRKALDPEAIQTLTISLSHPPFCDFCGDSQPMFVYAATRLGSGVFMDCWRWCACYDCSEFVEDDEWDSIIAKLTIQLRKVLPNVPAFQIQHAVRRALFEFHEYSIRVVQ